MLSSPTELFWEALPQYMAMGMPQEEFWTGEPRLAVSYREAWEIRRSNAMWAEWRSGIYHASAIAAAMSKDAKYPERPLGLPETEAEVEARERAAYEGSKAAFESFAVAFNAKMDASEEE